MKTLLVLCLFLLFGCPNKPDPIVIDPIDDPKDNDDDDDDNDDDDDDDDDD